MAGKWSRDPVDPVSEMLVPRHYGSIPTLFAAPKARTPDDLAGADLAFLGIPWSAPVPDSRMGAAGDNYIGSSHTPSAFRTHSLKYGGYLPELDVDVFERYRLVDYGDSQIFEDIHDTFNDAVRRVGDIIDAGAVPITIGGNSGPSSYAVLQAVAARAAGPTGVVNFDAHHDNFRGDWSEDTAEQPRWAGTWARRILDLPGVDPRQYFHVGLRGPRNDRAAFERFLEKGVLRAHILTYRDIAIARRDNFEGWAARIAAQAASGAAKLWIGIDPDVLDMGASPDFGDEPLGLRTEEICSIVYELGRAVGRGGLGGVSFMAVPNTATTIHWICVYILLYALAGTLQAEGA
jgi:agmatinase